MNFNFPEDRLEAYRKALEQYEKANSLGFKLKRKIFKSLLTTDDLVLIYKIESGLCWYFQTTYSIYNISVLPELSRHIPTCATFTFPKGELEPRIKLLKKVISETELSLIKEGQDE